MNARHFVVEHWGSDPDLNNDDCWIGKDFDTLLEAQTAFDTATTDQSTEFVRLAKCVGTKHDPTFGEIPVLEEIQRRRNPNHKPYDPKADEDLSEQAMQAGMAFGCDGYNDVMGY